MRFFNQISILAVPTLLILASTTAIAADPEVKVQIEKQSMYLGESVIYNVLLNHVDQPAEPDLTAIRESFDVEKLGEQDQNSNSITIINGVTTRNERRGRLYQYRLTPKSADTTRVPSPVATVDGKEISGEEIPIRVVAPEKQDTVFLEIDVDKNQVYPMQPFTVALKVSVMGLPGQYAGEDPVSVVDDAPRLAIPWFDDDQLTGIVPEKPWNETLQPLMTRRGGFGINSIQSDSVISLFDRRRKTGFLPRPTKSKRTNSDGDEIEYWDYKFIRQFTPKDVGDVTFGPVSIKGMFVSEIRNRRAIGKDIFAIAQPKVVTVKPVPTEGRPESWTGAIGRFKLFSSLSPTKARVGDPITLQLTLRGEGTLEQTQAPDLKSIPQIADNFRIYESTLDTTPDGKSRTFTFSLRPTTATLENFPSIEMASFDVDQEKYLSLRTDPIAVEFSEAERLANSDIVAGGRKSNSDSRLPVASEDGIFGNHTSVMELQNEAVAPANWLMAWAGILGLAFTGSLAASWFSNRNSDPKLVRKRNAFATAKTGLVSLNTSTANVDNVQTVVTQLIADLTGSDAAGLAARDAQEKLQEMKLPAELIESVGGFLDECDAARYGSATAGVSELKTKAEALVSSLQSRARQAV